MKSSLGHGCYPSIIKLHMNLLKKAPALDFNVNEFIIRNLTNLTHKKCIMQKKVASTKNILVKLVDLFNINTSFVCIT